MNRSLCSPGAPRAEPVPPPTSIAARLPKRWNTWKGLACVCLAAGGIGTFALDRALQEPDTAPGDPTERGPQPPTVWKSAYDDGPSEKIPVGALAPDFRLPDSADGYEVHLASLRGRKPVVLVFGSLSCNVLMGEIAKVKRFHQEHKDQADFLFVYIDEAGHGVSELEPSLDVLPKGPDQRRERVQKGRELLHFTMPTVLDTTDGAAQNAYDAWPRRLVVVDRDGRIAVDLGRGLSGAGWDFPKVEAWLRENAL